MPEQLVEDSEDECILGVKPPSGNHPTEHRRHTKRVKDDNRARVAKLAGKRNEKAMRQRRQILEGTGSLRLANIRTGFPLKFGL